MSLDIRPLPEHPCSPLRPEEVANAIAAGYIEWAHSDSSAWVRAQAEALTTIGLRAIVVPAESGWILLVRRLPAEQQAMPQPESMASAR